MGTEREKFEHFLAFCDDYTATKAAFAAAEREAELERLVMDGRRPASARKVWELELSQLQARTFAAAEEEEKEFDSEMAAAEETKDDLCRLQREIRDASDAVKEAVAALRSKTYGDQQPGLMGNWLEGIQKRFGSLCQEVSL